MNTDDKVVYCKTRHNRPICINCTKKYKAIKVPRQYVKRDLSRYVIMTRYVVLLVMMTSLWIPYCHGDKYSENDIRSQPTTPLRLLVSPRGVILRPDNKVTVKCRVKVMSRSSAITDSLRIGFNIMYDKGTVLPLTPYTPGVRLERFQTSRSKKDKRGRALPPTEGRKLTLSGEFYPLLLEDGKNWLSCRASVYIPDHEQSQATNSSMSSDGVMLRHSSSSRTYATARFVVIKAPPRSRKRQRLASKVTFPTSGAGS